MQITLPPPMPHAIWATLSKGCFFRDSFAYAKYFSISQMIHKEFWAFFSVSKTQIHEEGFTISLLLTVNLFRIEKSPWQTNQHHDHSTNLIIVKKIICRWHCGADCLSLPSDIQYCSASLHSRLDMHKNRFNTLEPLWKSNLHCTFFSTKLDTVS